MNINNIIQAAVQYKAVVVVCVIVMICATMKAAKSLLGHDRFEELKLAAAVSMAFGTVLFIAYMGGTA